MSSSAARRLVVLGGSGFVGSAAAMEALTRGLAVTCLSRSGQAPAGIASQPWASRATWAKADALQPDSYRQHLAGADAVIVAIGSPPLPFVDRAYQLRMNGDTNAIAAKTAKEAGVPQVVLIGAAMPPFTPRGYADGKRAAEAAARELADDTFGAAVLKPGAIYGTRYAGGKPIPLWAALAPVSAALRLLPGPLRAHAPVSVRHVAAAAVDAATEPRFRGTFTVLENEELFKHAPRAA